MWLPCELCRWQHLLKQCQEVANVSLRSGRGVLQEEASHWRRELRCKVQPHLLPALCFPALASLWSAASCSHCYAFLDMTDSIALLTGRQHGPSSLNSVSGIWSQRWMRKVTNPLFWTLSIYCLLSSIIIYISIHVANVWPPCLLPFDSPGPSLRLLMVCGLLLAFKTQAQMPPAALSEALDHNGWRVTYPFYKQLQHWYFITFSYECPVLIQKVDHLLIMSNV